MKIINKDDKQIEDEVWQYTEYAFLRMGFSPIYYGAITMLALDHFFILVEPEARVANLLVELGLEESFSREHPGQGTSNRCFSFPNSKLELLWLRDEEEANNGPAKDLQFPQRSTNKDASPFGLIFKRAATVIDNKKESSELAMPFNGWRYQPDYFPAPMSFHVGNNSENLIEPLCIYVPFMEPVERAVDLVIEKGKFKSISHVHIRVPADSLSPEMLIASHDGGFIYMLPYQAGESHRVSQGFNGSLSHVDGVNQYGVDFVMVKGASILAVRAGKVVKVVESSNVGGPTVAFVDQANYVVIEQGDGTRANYAHLQQNGALLRKRM
jgi:murein DD-endopeptidase MepM/ murein hydrolase activator NlpD